MVRISKSPEQRKQEILDAAKMLFQSKGYERTAVSDIVKEVGVAQGTFYYYFKSKDEIADAVIDRELAVHVAALHAIAELPDQPAMYKFYLVRQHLMQANDRMDEIEFLHEDNNAVLHQKALVRMINEYSPILAGIIEQGIRETVFRAEYPLQVAEFLLAGFQFLYDPGIFKWSEEEMQKKMEAAGEIIEKLLGAERGAFEKLLSKHK